MGLLKKFDPFGQSLDINFRKSSSFKTACGGTVGAILCFLLMLYTTAEVIAMVAKTDPNIMTTVTMIDLVREKPLKMDG
jgi:hypothetical protein